MSSPLGPAPLRLDDPDRIRRFRADLDRLGFVGQRIDAGDGSSPSFSPEERPRLLRRTDSTDPLAVLIRLFQLGGTVDPSRLAEAIAPADPADWAALGLIEQEGEGEGKGVRARLSLTSFSETVFAHDSPWLSGLTPTDHVMGLSGSTLMLHGVRVSPPSAMTLDLGCGGGFHALQAARHSQGVVACDQNPRAVNMARFNAVLNGVEAFEALEGDLLDPVRDRRFDLILSNPPFVISPDRDHLYRDGGQRADGLCERIVREAPGLLNEGGLLQMIGHFANVRGQGWHERLDSWLDGNGCDAWVLTSHVLPAESYVIKWLNDGDPMEPDVLVRRFDDWMAYFETEGIESVTTGVLVLRKRSTDRHFLRIDEGLASDEHAGESILLGLQLSTFLESLSDDHDLLDLHLRLAEDACVEHRLRPTSSGWTVTDASCRLDRGLAFPGEINEAIFHLLGDCRGDRTLGDVLGDLADALRCPMEVLVPDVLPVVRRFVERGYLLPPGIGDARTTD